MSCCERLLLAVRNTFESRWATLTIEPNLPPLYRHSTEAIRTAEERGSNSPPIVGEPPHTEDAWNCDEQDQSNSSC